MLLTHLLYWGKLFCSETCCRYSGMRLVSISSQEVVRVSLMSANCTGLTAITSVKINMTVIVSFSCMVEEAGLESAVGKDLLSEGEVGLLF